MIYTLYHPPRHFVLSLGSANVTKCHGNTTSVHCISSGACSFIILGASAYYELIPSQLAMASCPSNTKSEAQSCYNQRFYSEYPSWRYTDDTASYLAPGTSIRRGLTSPVQCPICGTVCQTCQSYLNSGHAPSVLHYFRCLQHLHHQKDGTISCKGNAKRMTHYGRNILIKHLCSMHAWWMNWIRLLMFSSFMLVIFTTFEFHDEFAAYHQIEHRLRFSSPIIQTFTQLQRNTADITNVLLLAIYD